MLANARIEDGWAAKKHNLTPPASSRWLREARTCNVVAEADGGEADNREVDGGGVVPVLEQHEHGRRQ